MKIWLDCIKARSIITANFTTLIFCSIHQLPRIDQINEIKFDGLIDLEIHFALEGIYGTGEQFLINCIKESEKFLKAHYIKNNKVDIISLHQMIIND